MPPYIVLLLGTIGAAVLAKFVASESRRVNEALDRQRNADKAVPKGTPLERDPVTGEYRPRKG